MSKHFKFKVGGNLSTPETYDLESKFVRGEFNSTNSYLDSKTLVSFDNESKRVFYVPYKPYNYYFKYLKYSDLKVDKIVSNIFFENTMNTKPKQFMYGKLFLFIGVHNDISYLYFVNYNKLTINVRQIKLDLHVESAHIYRLGTELFSDIKFIINDKTYGFDKNNRGFVTENLEIVEVKDIERIFMNKIGLYLDLSVQPKTLRFYKFVTFSLTYKVYTFMDSSNRFKCIAEIYGKFYIMPDTFFYELNYLNKDILKVPFAISLRRTGFLIDNDETIDILTKYLEKELKNAK